MRKELNKILAKVAEKHGVSVFEVRTEIQKLLDVSWGNPDTDKVWTRLHYEFQFKKPTLEHFYFHVLAKVVA